MVEENEEIKTEIKPKNKNKFYKLIKFISIALSLFIIGILIFYKVKNPELSVGVFLFLVVFFGIVAIVAMFGSKLFSLFNLRKQTPKEIVQPDPISISACYDMAIEGIAGDKFADRIGKLIEEGSEPRGKKVKSDIYTLLCKGKYEKDITYCVIINRHYPESKRKILINASPAKIEQVKNLLSSDPEDNPDTETITEENPLLGTKRVTQKTTHKRQDKPKPKPPEDLV